MAARSKPEVVQLKISLKYMRPPIWRRVQVPKDITLAELHDVIQVTFGWMGYHLHQFEVDDTVYGDPSMLDDGFGDRTHNEARLRLGQLVNRGITRFFYTYDFGDNWLHEIKVEKVLPAAPGVDYPVLTGGKRRAPPEDCGGVPGFAMFLEAINDESHPEHAEMREWHGESFDPDDMEREIVEARLTAVRARHRKRASPKGGAASGD
jgi:hypothetical protein